MGVRGLASYVNNNQEIFLEPFMLQDCNLVVDGSNFCGQLYKRLNNFLAFGGDYDKFGSYVRTFFTNLKRCNVTPYVLFDGSHEDKKLKTIFKRLQSNIQGASRIDLLKRGSLDIVPLLLRDVFKEAMMDVHVQYSICEFEADDEIAAMARHLNCPVLSFDSDFFIYGVLYVPFNTMKIEPVPLDGNGSKHAMECKIYKVDHVTTHFKGLQKESLPLLATLLGNDYVEREVFDTFFARFIINRGVGGSEQQRCIDGLLKWLQGESPDSAKSKILLTLEIEERDNVSSIIEKTVDGYKSEHCISLKYFKFNDSQDTTDFTKECTKVAVKDVTDKTNPGTATSAQVVKGLPTWVAERIRDRRIPKHYIDLYTNKLYFSTPQAEDYTDDDSFLCTLKLLRYAFDIINDFPKKNCEYISREKDWDCKTKYIGEKYATPRPLKIPFKDLTDEELRSYFNHFIQLNMKQLDLAIIKTLPSNFQVYMLSVLWWVSTCEVPLGHIHSLFICYLMLDQVTGTLTDSYNLNNNDSCSSKELAGSGKLEHTLKRNDPHTNDNKDQFKLAVNTLKKHFEIDEYIQKRHTKYDIKILHSFAQFQCCLMQMNCLNTLCRCPFENTKYCRTYNGTFVYNMAVELQNQTDPCKFLEKYLKGSAAVLNCYKSICNVYKRCAVDMKLQNAKINTKKSVFYTRPDLKRKLCRN